MNDLKTEFSCPLGNKCNEIKDGKIIRCAWFTKIQGKDPQSEKEIEDWACAMSWMPMLMVEMSQTNRGQTQAIESFRNESTLHQKVFNQILENYSKNRIEQD